MFSCLAKLSFRLQPIQRLSSLCRGSIRGARNLKRRQVENKTTNWNVIGKKFYTTDKMRSDDNPHHLQGKEAFIKASTSTLTLPISLQETIKMCEPCFRDNYWDQKTPEKIEEYQKSRLGILFKGALPTNHFWEKSYFNSQGWIIYKYDKVSNFLLEELHKKSTFTTYVLNAPTGSGKTGSIHKLGQKAFVFYTDCGKSKHLVRLLCSTDFSNIEQAHCPFQALQLKVESIIKNEEVTQSQKSLYLNQYCSVFWLSHAIALEILSQKQPGLTCQDWQNWTTANAGRQTITSIQSLLNEYFEKKDILSTEEIQTILLDPLLHKHKVWIAVDDAHLVKDVAQDIMSIDNKKNLLWALLNSFNSSTKRIVAGLGFIDVDVGDSAKKSSVFSQFDSYMTFPVVCKDTVKDELNKYLALNELESQCDDEFKKDSINYAYEALMGRPGFMALFFDILVGEQLRVPKDFTKTTAAPTTVDQAIELFKACAYGAIKKIRYDCQKSIERALFQQPTIMKTKFMARVLLNVVWSPMSPKDFESQFGFSLDEMGMFLLKHKWNNSEDGEMYYGATGQVVFYCNFKEWLEHKTIFVVNKKRKEERDRKKLSQESL